MSNLDEIFAACIVEYARRSADGIISGPFYVIGKDARDAFNLPYSEQMFSSAIAILEEIGSLTRYSRSGMQTFYRVNADAFDSAMKDAGLGVRQYAITRGILDGRQFDFLEAYSDLGADYLREALDAFDEQIAEAAQAEEVARTSSDKSRIPERRVASPRLEMSEGKIELLISELSKAEAELPKLSLSQVDQAQARAYLISARNLAEAPDPPADLIWELVSRANQISGIASLLVAILALFVG